LSFYKKFSNGEIINILNFLNPQDDLIINQEQV